MLRMVKKAGGVKPILETYDPRYTHKMHCSHVDAMHETLGTMFCDNRVSF